MVLGYHGRQPVFVSMPVTQAQAHVWLMGAVYDRLERWVAASGAPALEREAARWWFSRWRPAQPARGDEFARVVREQEFSLVDRPLVTLGGNTVLEHMLQAGLLDDLPPKQRTVAEGLAESAAGVWEVVSRAGDRAVFRDPVEGDEFSIAEHGEAEYGPGSIVLGRIVPFAGDTDLRSPGAAIVPASSARPGMALGFAEAVAKSGVDVPPPVAIEGMVQMVFGARGLPREVPLPVSPDQATVILRDLNVALRATGVAKEVDPAEAPERFRNAPDALVVGYEVDIVLADYLREMFPLSQKSRLYRQMTARRAHDERARKDPRGR
jgi:hypothetical protein